jgi:Mycobacterium membrane protein
LQSQACQQQANGRPCEPIGEITISSQLGERATAHPTLDIHISNIGTIRHALDDRAGEVYDYPDEIYETDGADYLSGEDGYGEPAWSADRRWRPVVAIAGAVVATCAIATAVILNSGDSATTKATVGVPTPTPKTLMTTPSAQPAPRTTIPPGASPGPTGTAQLPPETVTTVTPPPSIGPQRTPNAVPPTALPPGALPPQAALDPRTVVYSVTGTKQLLDLVTVVYTDAQGYPRTELNVALPWTKAVVLNPGVQTQSVIATSIYSRLDCSIVNAAGQPVVVSNNNSMIAACTR